ncbi:MAG TPA: glutamine synthetase family protein [Streptosporangiaceae bacterium]|nr:glutamine synthetase family protein [Streptosporangiaceae bacterium]
MSGTELASTELPGLTGQERAERTRRAGPVAERLRAAGVTMVALCWVDNAGITRVKCVPAGRLERAAGWGIGMSPVFDVFLVNDDITTSEHIGGPVGDLRLVPDLDRITVLAGQPGWAWAPVDRYTQDGRRYVGCQRSFARRMAAVARRRGLELRMSIEVEWAVGTEEDGNFVPACHGPAYGMTRVIELSGYAREVVEALEEQGVVVEQFHPEYAAGQLEISIAAADPVAAADDSVLVRQTIRAVSAAHGFQASFAPSVVAGSVGNGGHVHLSLWRDGQNLLADGPGPYGLRPDGEAFAAGILGGLPALSAVGAPSVASYLRLVPSHWAGAFQCWGRENREAALRLVTGSDGEQDTRANLEVKCFDLAANPYLLTGSLIAAGLAGLHDRARLPEEMPLDPASLTAAELDRRGIRRLPQSLSEAAGCLAGEERLREAMGDPLFRAFLAVRDAESEMFTSANPAEVAAQTRWRW